MAVKSAMCHRRPQTASLALRASEDWERSICENRAFAILRQLQTGRFLTSKRKDVRCWLRWSWTDLLQRRNHLSATSQKQPTPSLASPPYGSMPGPAQLEVLRLKVVLATEADVHQALRSKGFTRTRVSQLWTECLQSPPRSWAQRELQTAQDQPNCNQSASKELNSTNDAPSIIYPDSIIDAIQEILLRRSYR